MYSFKTIKSISNFLKVFMALVGVSTIGSCLLNDVFNKTGIPVLE